METIARDIIDCERRTSRQDRRHNHRQAAIQSFYKKRRTARRRVCDRKKPVYIDIHDPKTVMLALGIMLMSICDAFFTMRLLSYGSEELNPVLAALIEIDLTLFLFIKFFITGAAVSFLVMHRFHLILNRVSGQQLLVLCALIYMVLIAYEINMVRHLPILI